MAPVEQLVSWVYVSSASKAMNEEEILELLRVARRKNEQLGITGMLLYRDGNFLQVLEGPESAVDHVLDNIKRDSRHHDMFTLSRRTIEERQFADWRMAFRNMNKVCTEMDGHSRFLETGAKDEETQEGSQLVFRLLRMFKENVR